MKKVELLAPAGNLDKLKIAILYGKKFSLRARASNFDLEDIKEACEFAKVHHAGVHVTMNIIPHNEDFEELEEYLKYLESVGVSAIITSSMHIMKMVKQVAPKLEIHMSTQLSITNSGASNYYESIGANRVVLGREVSIDQIAEIRKKTKVGLEVFIHGGMCSSYSGRCMLSNHFVNRDANRGGCAHSCRWNYRLYDNDNLMHEENTFFNFGSKDLVALKAITKLLDIGVDSFKIEGRMKSAYYIATVVRCYRNLIDDYYANREINYSYYLQEMAKAENRDSSTGFLFGDITVKEQVYQRDEHPTKEFVGIVLDYDKATGVVKVEQRNHFRPGDELEFFGPQLPNRRTIVKEIKDEDNNILDAARHPRQIIFFEIDFEVSPNDMIRLVQG